MTSSCDALVVGAGGFLGGHLVRSLLLQGLQVRAVDVRPLDAWCQVHRDADNRVADLSIVQNAVAATSGATTVYELAAAPAGGPRVDRMTGVLVDTHLLLAARETGVDRFVVASSAVDVPAALEAATPDDRCWRHLFTERLARHFLEDFGVQTRVARLGPVYGEHAHRGDVVAVANAVVRPVAVAAATRRRTVEIPYRADDIASQIYVDDAVLGLQLVAHGTDACGPHDVVDPRPATVAEVVDTVLAVAGVELEPVYRGSVAPPRVVGCPETLAAAVGWEPDIALAATLPRLYAAAADEARAELHLPTSVADHAARRRGWSPGPSAHPGRRHATAGGRHRYENAG